MSNFYICHQALPTFCTLSCKQKQTLRPEVRYVPNGVEIPRVVMLTSHKITILIGHNANLTRV